MHPQRGPRRLPRKTDDRDLWRSQWPESVPFLAVLTRGQTGGPYDEPDQLMKPGRPRSPATAASSGRTGRPQVLYLAVQNLDEYRGAHGRNPKFGLETSAPSNSR